jgi:hypothetical protein
LPTAYPANVTISGIVSQSHECRLSVAAESGESSIACVARKLIDLRYFSCAK